jgi:predicted transcriptional regulator
MIGNLLYPKAKFEVLRTLALAHGPVPLREIAYRSGLQIGSVQSSLRTLLKDDLVESCTLDNRLYYSLPDNEVKMCVLRILKIFEPYVLQSKALLVRVRAANLLQQLEERHKIIEFARESLKK